MAGGRPSKYKAEFAQKAQELCEQGATDIEIADFLGVSDQTVRNWKHKHPAFFMALNTGKEAADVRVERSLYHKAIGYTFEAVKIFMPSGASAPVYAPYREHVAPDTTAAIFWLKNRRPDLWRDKTEQSVTHLLTDDLMEKINAKPRGPAKT
jgi:hypothetical protein